MMEINDRYNKTLITIETNIIFMTNNAIQYNK